MKTRILLLLFLISAHSAHSAQVQLPREIECGVFRVKGQLRGHKGVEAIHVYPDTQSEFEIPVLGLTAEQSISLDEVYVDLELEIFRLRPQDSPRAKLRKVNAKTGRVEATENPVRKIRSQACGKGPTI